MFDQKASLELDRVTAEIEAARARGHMATVTRLNEEKRRIEAYVFDGKPRPNLNKRKVDYYVYIKSDEWAMKAEEAKRRAGYRCQVCNRGQDVIGISAHHRSYDRLGEELPEDITVLCDDHHEMVDLPRIKRGIFGGKP